MVGWSTTIRIDVQNSNAIKFPLCQNARCDVTTLVVMIQAQWTRVCVEKLLA